MSYYVFIKMEEYIMNKGRIEVYDVTKLIGDFRELEGCCKEFSNIGSNG